MPRLVPEAQAHPRDTPGGVRRWSVQEHEVPGWVLATQYFDEQQCSAVCLREQGKPQVLFLVFTDCTIMWTFDLSMATLWSTSMEKNVVLFPSSLTQKVVTRGKPFYRKKSLRRRNVVALCTKYCHVGGRWGRISVTETLPILRVLPLLSLFFTFALLPNNGKKVNYGRLWKKATTKTCFSSNLIWGGTAGMKWQLSRADCRTCRLTLSASITLYFRCSFSRRSRKSFHVCQRVFSRTRPHIRSTKRWFSTFSRGDCFCY